VSALYSDHTGGRAALDGKLTGTESEGSARAFLGGKKKKSSWGGGGGGVWWGWGGRGALTYTVIRGSRIDEREEHTVVPPYPEEKKEQGKIKSNEV